MLFYEFGRLAFSPGIVGLRKSDAFVERRVVVEPDFHGFGGCGFGKVNFAENLKTVRGDPREIGNDAVHHFEAILIGLMLEVAAEGIVNRRDDDAENQRD